MKLALYTMRNETRMCMELLQIELSFKKTDLVTLYTLVRLRASFMKNQGRQ